MSQAGAYTPGAVNEAFLEVRVNGIPRKHERVEFAGDTPGGLPSQVVSTGTGMVSRTGSITWAPPEGVLTEAPHPLRQESGWPPRRGDRVEIDATINGVTFRRFTGRLGKTTGALNDGTLQSEITDTLADHLAGPVNIPPRIPDTDGQAYRVVWEALEQCRLGLLPRPEEGPGETAIHATPQGDTWATIGTAEVTGATTSTRDVSAGIDVWTNLTCTPDEDITRLGRSVLLVARGSTQHDSSVSLRLTDGTAFRLEHDLGGALRLYVNNTLVREGVWSEPGVPILAFAVTIGFVYVWTSRTDYAAAATASFSSSVLDSSGEYIAATHLRYLTSAEATQIVRLCPDLPAALRLPSVTFQSLPATRGFENVVGRSVVDSWGGSVLASVWMDEFGQTEIQSRAVMLSRPVQRYVRLSERAFGGSWAQGEDDVYSGVVVSGEQGVVRSSGDLYRITIYKDSSPRGFEEDVVEERFIEADPNTDWGPIDLDAETPGAQWEGSPLQDSWYGAVVTNSSQGSDWEGWVGIYGVGHTFQIERLGQRTLKLTEGFTGIPAGERVYCKIASSGTIIDRAVRGQPTPFIRAQWASHWAPYTRRASGGPDYAAVFEHEVGWWLSPSDAQKLANALAAEVTSPMVTLGSTPLLWDPRRQVGDIENWWAQDSAGKDVWVARVLITGYRESWDGHVPTQSVDARVISMTDPNSGTTYDDLGEAYDTYLDIVGSGGTYDQVYDALPSAY